MLSNPVQEGGIKPLGVIFWRERVVRKGEEESLKAGVKVYQ